MSVASCCITIQPEHLFHMDSHILGCLHRRDAQAISAVQYYWYPIHIMIPNPYPYTHATNNVSCFQDSQLFAVASLGLFPIILSSIKYCDSQESNCVSNTVKCSKAACVGDSSIIQTTHKTMDSTSLCKWSNHPDSLPISSVRCAIKAGEKPGNKARLSHILFWFLCWNQLPSFCFIGQVMTVIKMPFQSGNSLALHQRAIKDAIAANMKTKHYYSTHNLATRVSFGTYKHQCKTSITSMWTESSWAFPESYTTDDSWIMRSRDGGQRGDKRAHNSTINVSFCAIIIMRLYHCIIAITMV